MNYSSFVGLLLLMASSIVAVAEDRILFGFNNPEAAKSWQTVNDGVMGGRSSGRFKINDDKKMEFFGTLSLENNGGFASVRARDAKLGLEKGESIIARVRGDGREYNFNLYSQRNLGGYSYRQSFKTKKDEWIEVEFPADKFVATWRGRVFPNEKLDTGKVTGLGFLLGDKKAGPFKLEVEWIKVGKTLGEMFKVLCSSDLVAPVGEEERIFPRAASCIEDRAKELLSGIDKNRLWFADVPRSRSFLGLLKPIIAGNAL
jgi:monofunctional biosynthetic peptidoglycan transglycosylase